MIHVSHLTKSLVVSFDARIAALFPHGQRFEFEGEQLILVPHGVDETQLLRNLGYAGVPSPIEEHYEFPSADGKRPFSKQVLTSASMTMYRRSFVLNGMGTGKTKACIWAFDYLKRVGRAKRMLVVCPLSTMRFTWEREIFNTIPTLKVEVLSGSADRRRRHLANDADIYIINHDGIKTLFRELKNRFGDINVICFDEVAAFRNSKADRSKAAQKLAEFRTFVWGMTGSPTPTSPTDAFGLAKLIVPDTAPHSFTHFRQETMLNINQFKWVPKRGAAEVVAKTLTPAVRFTLEDIVELPPVIDREIQIEMGERQKKTYAMLKEHAAAMLREGTITAVNGGVLFSKLLQTSIGWVYGDDGKTYELDNHNRINALLDIVRGGIDVLRPEGKIIVFSPFISATSGISLELKKAKIDYAEVTGSTSPGERGDIFQAFQHTEKYRVLNAHPDCMSHGLTLTAADTIVWFGPTTKLETFTQANARITRVGQTRKQQIIRLTASPVERATYARLQQRQDLQSSVLDIIAEVTGGVS